MNNNEEEKRKKIEEYYESLSPEQRRRDIILSPEFRDAYNEITQAHRFFQLPQYYLEKWRPLLGPVAHAVYEELRRKIFYNPQTGERRETVYLKQETLAESIGVKARKTIRKALKTLESYNFIRRDYKHYKNPHSGRVYRGADKFTVYFEIPLVYEDAIELLLRNAINEADFVKGKKSPLQIRDPKNVDNSVVKGNLSPLRAEENIPSVYNTKNITNNVKTLVNKNPYKEKNEYLVDVLAQKLGREEENAAFYKKVCFNLPSNIIMQALAAVEDKFMDSLDPAKEGFKVNKSAYFTGVIKNLAKEENIDF